jgi:nucleoside-diphosphate-sugar epimerase
MKNDTGSMTWTILRPCHIYGPGSLLGCLPAHSRDAELLQRLQNGEALKLVGGGHFLQQPIFAADLAATILSCAGNEKSYNQIFMAAGPEIVESREYYRIIADLLNVKLRIEELPVTEYLAGNPDAAPFLCHRFYDLAKLRAAGLAVPSTSLSNGLQQQVASLQKAKSGHPAMS